MPIPKADVTLTFGQGIDDTVDARLLPPGKLRDLQNGQFTKAGAVKKRPGFDAYTGSIATGGSLANATSKVHALGEALLLTNGNDSKYTYSESTSSWIELATNAASADVFLHSTGLDVNLDTYYDEDFGVYSFDCAEVGNYRLFAIVAAASSDIEASGVFVYVTDAQTGAVIKTFTLATSTCSYYTRVRMCVQGTDVVIFYGLQTNNSIGRAIWDSTDPTTTPSSSGIIASSADATFEAVAVTTNLIAVVHKLGSATTSNNLTVLTMTNSGSMSAATVLYAGDATNGLDDLYDVVALNSTHCQAIFFEGGSSNTHYVVGFDPTHGSVSVDFAATDISSSIGSTQQTAVTGCPYDADEVSWFTQRDVAGGTVSHLRVSDAGATTGGLCLSGGIIGGRPVQINSNYYLPVYSTDLTDPGFYLIPAETTPRRNYARLFVGDAGVLPLTADYASGVTFYRRHILPGNITIDSNPALPVIREKNFEQWNVVFASFEDASNKHPKSVQYKDALVLSGSVPQIYDGAKIFPLGFIQPPVISSLSEDSGNGSVANGTYSVTAIFEYVDSNGNIYRSAPAVAKSITISSGPSAITCVMRTRNGQPGLAETGTLNEAALFGFGGTAIRTKFFRTQDSETVYYEAGAPADLGDQDLIQSDSDISDNATLYTDSGELSDIGPPFINNLVVHKNRVLADTGDGRIWISKPPVDGYGVAFSNDPSMVLDADVGTGDVTTLASMDGRLIVFTENGIHYRDGEPPNASGIGAMTPPRPIASSVGAVRGSPTVVTSMGLFFVSTRGIELLGRDLTVVPFFGQAVEDNATGNVTSIVDVKESNELRFTYDSGDLITYNYKFNQWGTYPSVNATGACLHNQVYTIAMSSGTVWKETAADFDDAGTSYVFSARTAWFKPKDVQGYFRVFNVKLLNEYKANHTYTVEVYVDYDETSAVETKTLAVTSGTPLEMSFKPSRGKVQAIQFVVKDASTSGTEESFALVGLHLEIGIIGGAARLGASLKL